MNILFCFDQKYEQHFGVALTSLLLNNKHLSVQVYLITDVASQQLIQNLNQLKKNHLLNDYKIYAVEPKQLANLKVSLHISEAAYYRLMAANFLPENLDKILYLDSDLVVVSSLQKLYELDISEYYIAAYATQSRTFKQRLSLNNNLYFNSGVMLINLQKWREDEIGEKAIDFVEKNPDVIKNWDQDALNKVIDGQILKLDRQWNLLVDLGREKNKRQMTIDQQNQLKEANIIHYVGSSKPWYFWINNPKKSIYWSYLEQSLWSPSQLHSILIQLGYIKRLIARKLKEYLP